MSKLAEPTRVEWRVGELFVRLDTEKERVAISAVRNGATTGHVVNIGTQEAVTLSDMLRNAVAWLDAKLDGFDR